VTHLRTTIDADVHPRFTACYLREAGDECAFIESHTAHALPRLMAALASHGRTPDQVRYVVLTHAHLDHAAGAGLLLEACPNATLLAHPRTVKHMVAPEKLIEGAKAVYGEARFADLYGEVRAIDATRVRSLEDGATFSLGDAPLTAWHTYGHAFHHLVVDDPRLDCVYTGDTFGLVYPELQGACRFVLPSTSPTGFDAHEAHKSIDKVLGLGRRWVCLTHYDGYENPVAIANQLRRFIDHAATWVRELERSELEGAELEAELRGRWRQAITSEAPHFGPEAFQLLGLDVELNAQGLAYAVTSARKKAV
jgi:glyoxylase-like metal-dependent hydrolase (beta-lactamase superfamily II)